MKNCLVCNKISKIGYGVFRLLYKTDHNDYTIGLHKLCDEIDDYIMNKGYHLSSTQIILLRPDILLDFLQTQKAIPKKERIKEFALVESMLCPNCYEHYIELVPAK